MHNQDCIEGMGELPDESIDTIITDPPYGLSFMGKEWDDFTDNEALQKWTKQWSEEALRVAKPGAIMLCFGGTRTWHRIACGIEDAGWEIRDTVIWAYGSGFPKSHNIGKAVDKKLGNEREEIGEYQRPDGSDPRRCKQGYREEYVNSDSKTDQMSGETVVSQGDTKWEGYGTALKPAWEPIIMAMKPYENTYAENALEYGVAGLNIDGARVGTEGRPNVEIDPKETDNNTYAGRMDGSLKGGSKAKGTTTQGRFPANLILDSSEEVKACFPETDGGVAGSRSRGWGVGGENMENHKAYDSSGYGDNGSASRYFKRIKYSAKASKKERNKGLDGFEDRKVNKMGSFGDQSKFDCPDGANRVGDKGSSIQKNNHPTVKPLALMQYLVELTKMPNEDQIYLDPFIGSGTTGMAVRRKDRNYIGYEKEEEYVEIARARIRSVEDELI